LPLGFFCLHLQSVEEGADAVAGGVAVAGSFFGAAFFTLFFATAFLGEAFFAIFFAGFFDVGIIII